MSPLRADGFVTLGPAFEFGDAYEYSPADADHAQVAEDVALEMVSADAESGGGLVEGECDAHNSLRRFEDAHAIPRCQRDCGGSRPAETTRRRHPRDATAIRLRGSSLAQGRAKASTLRTVEVCLGIAVRVVTLPTGTASASSLQKPTGRVVLAVGLGGGCTRPLGRLVCRRASFDLAVSAAPRLHSGPPESCGGFGVPRASGSDDIRRAMGSA